MDFLNTNHWVKEHEHFFVFGCISSQLWQDLLLWPTDSLGVGWSRSSKAHSCGALA